MIQLQHIYKTYHGSIHALRDISFEIQKGEFVFLTGPSGAGKTTLFKLICAFDKMTSGKIKVAGHDLSEMKPEDLPLFRRKVGIVFQDYKLIKNLTIAENIALPLKILGTNKVQIQAQVSDILKKFELFDKKEFLPEFLSGGEQQRIAIARALIHNPELIIADEPTGNIDQERAIVIMELLKKISDQGTTVLVSTHNVELMKGISSKSIHLKNGEVQAGPGAVL